MPDLELERFQQDIDLVAYARSLGYRPMPDDSRQRLAVVLEHDETRDRIAVARAPSGPWLYARLEGYEPRAPEEPPDRAAARLRACISEARDKGTIVEFVQTTERTLGRDTVSVDRVREQLRAWDRAHRTLGPEAPERSREVEAPRSPGDRSGRSELNRRQGDWHRAPDPRGSPADRVGAWKERLSALEQEVRGPHRRKQLSFDPGAATRARDVQNLPIPRINPEQSLRHHHARTDWDQQISREHAERLGLVPPRSRGPERGR